jgi:hypothetical protein
MVPSSLPVGCARDAGRISFPTHENLSDRPPATVSFADSADSRGFSTLASFVPRQFHEEKSVFAEVFGWESPSKTSGI